MNSERIVKHTKTPSQIEDETGHLHKGLQVLARIISRHLSEKKKVNGDAELPDTRTSKNP